LAAGAAGAALLAAAGCGEAPVAKVYDRALAHLRDGETGRAAAELEEVLAREPDGERAGDAWNRLGMARKALGETDAAAKAFEAAAERDPSDWTPPYHLAMIELERGNIDRAAPLLKQAAQLHAEGEEVMLLLADTLTRMGKLERAKSAYFQAEKRNPQSAAAATGLGRVLLLEGDAARAETEFMKALEIDKDYAPALYNLGVLHSMREGQGEQAAVYFRRYLDAAPEGERAAAAKERLGGASIPQTGFGGGAGSGGGADAQELWKRAEAEKSPSLAARALEAAQASGDPMAGEIAKRTFAGFPKAAEAQLAAGAYWEAEGNRSGAALAYRRAQALEPENPQALKALARVAMDAGEHDTAVMALKRLVTVEPGNADALWELADLYGDKLGMTGKGVAAYREFERAFPADPRASEVAARIRALEEAAEPLPEDGEETP